MSDIADEDKWVGEEIHLVPTVDPDDQCNGKKKRKADGEVVRNEDNHVIFDGYCNNPAGKGTDHFGEGRCKFHAGQSTGAPAHNQNGQKNALDADPHHYHENLPPEEQEWIDRIQTSLLTRVKERHGRDPDFLDQVLTRLVSIELHIVFKASDYSKDELVQVIVQDGGSFEQEGALVKEVRRYGNNIVQNLNKLGLLESPEQQKADELGQWREFIEGDDDSDVVDVGSD